MFSVGRAHRASRPPGPADPNIKTLRKGVFPLLRLGDQWLFCRVDAVEAKERSSLGSLGKASGMSAEPGTQFYEGLELRTGLCLPNSQGIDTLNRMQPSDSHGTCNLPKMELLCLPSFFFKYFY